MRHLVEFDKSTYEVTGRGWRVTEAGEALLAKYYEYYELAIPRQSSYLPSDVLLRTIGLILLDQGETE